MISNINAADVSEVDKKMPQTTVSSGAPLTSIDALKYGNDSSTGLQRMFFEYPGISSPVYTARDAFFIVETALQKAIMASPTRSNYPCGR